jgi:hypothetical protein
VERKELLCLNRNLDMSMAVLEKDVPNKAARIAMAYCNMVDAWPQRSYTQHEFTSRRVLEEKGFILRRSESSVATETGTGMAQHGVYVCKCNSNSRVFKL